MPNYPDREGACEGKLDTSLTELNLKCPYIGCAGIGGLKGHMIRLSMVNFHVPFYF